MSAAPEEPDECAEGCPEPGTGKPEGTPVSRHGKLSVVGTELIDEHGEPVQLKGVSSMWLNWESRQYSTSKEGLAWLRDNWNLSLFRAAMGVEPDGAYLKAPEQAKAKVRAIVQNAIELDVYVLIDWHDHNAHEHPEQAREFFAEMAAEFGEYPNVLYETFNEPLKVSWSADLKPYHESIVETVRAADPDNVIVLGTPNWSQFVDEASRDPLEGENLMYTLHFYACTHTGWLRSKAETALAAGLPLFVTEWGATTADGGVESPTPCLDEAAAWHELMNRKKISWAAWKFDGCTDGSCILRGGANVAGPFGDDVLNGHGPFVRDRMLD
jgi:aryl-phospho-beta-D-glucosidase BglC (GH1 family)